MDKRARVGFWLSLALLLVCLVYTLTVIAGMATYGRSPIRDPILAVMEVLTVLSGPLLVAVMVVIHGMATGRRRRFASLALVAAIIMVVLTTLVHGLALTMERGDSFSVFVWPSRLYALELLAWDLFLGISLLAASQAVAGPGDRLLRPALLISGLLCLAGIAGPLSGQMAFQRLGMLGYGVGLPVVSRLLARFFWRQARPDSV